MKYVMYNISKFKESIECDNLKASGDITATAGKIGAWSIRSSDGALTAKDDYGKSVYILPFGVAYGSSKAFFWEQVCDIMALTEDEGVEDTFTVDTPWSTKSLELKFKCGILISAKEV